MKMMPSTRWAIRCPMPMRALKTFSLRQRKHRTSQLALSAKYLVMSLLSKKGVLLSKYLLIYRT